MQSFEFRAMNTAIMLQAEGAAARLAQGFAAARDLVAESERRFTRFAPASELSQLNRSAGTWFRASPELLEVMTLARDLFLQTGGLFDPAILPDLVRAGYDRSMELIRAAGSVARAGPDPFPHATMSDVWIDSAGGAIFLPAGTSIDLGGIAKGWIAEQAALRLADYSTACAVSAGGDMFMIGPPEGESAWTVALEDPRDPDAMLADLRVPPGALATSSTARRTWRQGGAQRHHLIDPRTGEPAESDWLSVSVMSPHAAVSEVFAKALLIAGPRGAEGLVREADQIGYLAVDRAGLIWGPRESLEYIHVD